MLKRILPIIIRKLASYAQMDAGASNASKSSWEIYKDYIKIHPTAIIDPAAHIKIFNLPDPPRICLEIGEYSHIFSSFSILRPDAKITIGKRCQLGASSFIAAESITIGDDVLMAWGCTIMDSDTHSMYWKYRKNDVRQCYYDYLENKENFIINKDWSKVVSKPIRIGNRVWVGFDVSILKGVTIGDESVLGAASLINKNLRSGSIVSGNPAKIIKKIK